MDGHCNVGVIEYKKTTDEQPSVSYLNYKSPVFGNIYRTSSRSTVLTKSYFCINFIVPGMEVYDEQNQSALEGLTCSDALLKCVPTM